MANPYSERNSRSLIVSDTQDPFSAEKALEFVQYNAKYYGVLSDNIYHAGDETDQYHGGQWKKSPNALHTPKQEIAAVRYRLGLWYSAFPKMKLAISNHGLRWARKAFDAEIPEEVLRSYREIIQAPDGWKWKEEWRIIDGKMPWRLIHGMGYSGMNGHRIAAMDGGISTVIGHLHAHAGIAHIHTDSMRLWGMNVGSLIDLTAYAFEYGKYLRFKPCNGIGLVLNHGTTPIWIPYDL